MDTAIPLILGLLFIIPCSLLYMRSIRKGKKNLFIVSLYYFSVVMMILGLVLTIKDMLDNKILIGAAYIGLLFAAMAFTHFLESKATKKSESEN